VRAVHLFGKKPVSTSSVFVTYWLMEKKAKPQNLEVNNSHIDWSNLVSFACMLNLYNLNCWPCIKHGTNIFNDLKDKPDHSLDS
jgi:hypothetical protein